MGKINESGRYPVSVRNAINPADVELRPKLESYEEYVRDFGMFHIYIIAIICPYSISVVGIQIYKCGCREGRTDPDLSG